MTERTQAKPDQPLYFCGLVSVARRPVLDRVIQQLAARHPRASGPALHDMIVDAGIIALAKQLTAAELRDAAAARGAEQQA